MKKSLLIAISMILYLSLGTFLFTGCGEEESASSGVSATEEGNGEEATAEESEFPIVVEDNDYFKFEITECDDFWGNYSYKVTNKMDKDIIFEGEKAVINGETTVDAFIYTDLAAGTSGNDSFYLGEEDLRDYSDGEEVTLTIQYKVIDADSYSDITSGSFDFNITK